MLRDLKNTLPLLWFAFIILINPIVSLSFDTWFMEYINSGNTLYLYGIIIPVSIAYIPILAKWRGNSYLYLWVFIVLPIFFGLANSLGVIFGQIVIGGGFAWLFGQIQRYPKGNIIIVLFMAICYFCIRYLADIYMAELSILVIFISRLFYSTIMRFTSGETRVVWNPSFGMAITAFIFVLIYHFTYSYIEYYISLLKPIFTSL